MESAGKPCLLIHIYILHLALVHAPELCLCFDTSIIFAQQLHTLSQSDLCETSRQHDYQWNAPVDQRGKATAD